MKTSISLFMSDVLPHKKKLYHRIVKSKIFKDRTTDDVFTQLKKLGLDGFELLLPQYAVATDTDIFEIKKLIKQYNFPVLSVHQALRFLTSTKIEEVTRLFEIASMLESKVIVLHINSARKQIFQDSYIKDLHDLEKKYKVKVTFENMERHAESYFHSHRWHAIKFSDLVKKTDFHMTFDIVHLAHSGGNILKFYEHNKERILNVHLSDYKKHLLNTSLRPMRYKHMPLGKGELPIDALVSLLRKEKYKGLITLEINTDMQGVEESVAKLKELMRPQKGL